MEKSLLNIAGIIAIVLGIICCITIVGAIIGIPMIIGGNKLREYSNMSDEEIIANKDTILIWTIVFLFINQISGIICLIFYLSIDNNIFSSKPSSSSNNKYDELEKLNKLYKDKVLTKEEFEKEKERILNK